MKTLIDDVEAIKTKKPRNGLAFCFHCDKSVKKSPGKRFLRAAGLASVIGGMMKITRELIEECKTARGGFLGVVIMETVLENLKSESEE